tara:strand:+ start:67 stop:1284 length:1218 start_codon:yes stop_codon:yes gene_type:complete
MKKLLLIVNLFLLALSNLVQAQYCSQDNRFTEIEYFSLQDVDSVSNVVYGSAIDYQGTTTTLILDIYFPDQNVDLFNLRPLVLMIHGGGFVAGDKDDRKTECITLAQKGYVAATINYRLGGNTGPQNIQAIYRAHQDANASLRYLASNYSTYGIDTNWIFIGGSSAGAITANNVNYTSQNEWNILFPGIETMLGSLDTSGNTYTNSFDLKGIFNNWGAVPINSIQSSEMIPQIAFHGELDQTVDIDTATSLIGSRSIHYALLSNNICSDITIDSVGNHGIFTDQAGAIFRASKASCFFRSVFCNDCQDVYTTDSIPANCSSTVGLGETIILDKILAYPNPVKEVLTIEGVPKNTFVTIYNIMGELIRTEEYINGINFSSLKQGIYVVQVFNSSNGTNNILKILKE